ncbi:MAG: N-acetylmuramoyl-L-alanine amidase [Solirubrobacterales bacterium]
MAGVAAIAGLVWAAAPAISLGPFVPEPVNFEQAVPSSPELPRRESRRSAGGHADEGPVRYLTEPIVAPKRFDLVGLTGAGEPVEVRARLVGGDWSRWVETNSREPVWTGGSDELQIRSRGEAPRGEIGYVNVSGDATAGDRALNGARGALNTAFVSVASVLAPASATGEAPFDVVNRTEWDPDNNCVPKAPVEGEVRAGVVHHTVNANDYTAAEASGVVLAICRYHRYSNGWNDIGYNALVDRFGNVYAGRAGGLANAIIGAHTAGFNSQTFGVASIGDHTVHGLSKPAIDSITDLLAWKLSLHGIDGLGTSKVTSAGGAGNKYSSGTRVATAEVTRHRRFNETACPGGAQIKKILRITQEKIASGTFTPPEETPPAGGVVPG